jgi:glycosyltransferase involved in cell wall biosynthesis
MSSQALPAGTRIVIASRCAWTTWNFRRGLMAELQSAGAEVTACGAGGDGYEEKLAAAGFRFVSLPMGRGMGSPLADLRYLLHVRRLLLQLRPHIFHAFTVKPVIFGTIAAALAAVPVRIVTITGLGHAFTSSSWWLRTVVAALYRWALSRTHLVYFQNAEDREQFLQRGIVSSAPTRMIAGSGVDTERFAPATRRTETSTATFVMVARALRDKGVREYFKAGRLVRETGEDAVFRFVGGVDPRNPSSLSQAEMESAAREAGVEWIDHAEDVRPHMAAADIVVLPSYREGTPMSLLEAAAMAKPMIATAVPGCREVVREGSTGWLVPAQDADALASAMRRAIAERDRWEPFGNNARTLVLARFDAWIVIRQMLADYVDLLARSAR